MKKKLLWFTALIGINIFFLANSNNCTRSAKHKVQLVEHVHTPERTLDLAFKNYWFQGQAELSVYDVQQERYGAIRKAQQVMIFVTEDFSREKHVKIDNPSQAGADRLPVLKLNTIRRFHTGIYDYSLMESVFSPLDGSPAIKNTLTVQDWCGHVFTQLDKNETGYRVQRFSYFESESDSEFEINSVEFLESDLWTRLRLGPQHIQNGTYRVIPAAIFSRLRHIPLQCETAKISISSETGDTATQKLTLQYKSIDRKLEILFENRFPYRITGWVEWDNSKLMSTGKIRQTRKTAYWKHNKAEDRPMRDSLFLFF